MITSREAMLLWGKTDKDKGKTHALACHMIDVGMVIKALWQNALSWCEKEQFAKPLHLDIESTGNLLAFLGSLHDLGKASPAFQCKFNTGANLLRQHGFRFLNTSDYVQLAHGLITTWSVEDILSKEKYLPEVAAHQMASALGGHHGSWPTADEYISPAKSTNLGDENWKQARYFLFEIMKQVFYPPSSGLYFPEDPQETNVFLTQFSGLVSVADWMGSMEDYFGYHSIEDIQAYAQDSEKIADNLIIKLGWTEWQAPGNELAFNQMFSFLPNDIQKVILPYGDNISLPALAIIEAPTGSGKTEMALYLADTWLQRLQGNGIYIAMPTMATSNQMFARFKEFLLRRYPEQILNLHLLHSAALIAKDEPSPHMENVSDEDNRPASGGVRAETWFLPRKRTLLAPFGVGTVDQALMGVLQTRHFFVRLFGLGNKVVVFDEIHAYDTYMSELFQRLLAWLRSMGTSVILLSATLPEKTRGELVSAYLGIGKANPKRVEYPRLTLANQDGIQCHSLLSPELHNPFERTLQLEWSNGDTEAVVEKIRRDLQDGGCAAVICNRVKRAQEIYLALKESGLIGQENLILFHARYPYQWREEIEKCVLKRFGKNGQRAGRTVVIATQVIEQSLDLDFDLMLTDMAPIDLILQRAGRLHRHAQNDSSRPEKLKTPRLILLKPKNADGIPNFGKDEYVYERAILLKTWAVIKNRTEIRLPSETSPLIEAVYGEQLDIKDSSLVDAIRLAEKKALENEHEAVFQARQKLIPRTDDEDFLSKKNQNLEEDDPRIHKALSALTRLAEPGITLVCLHRINGSIFLDPKEDGEPLDIHQKPDYNLTRELLRRSVSLQRPKIMKYLSQQGPHPAWVEIAALRYQFPVVFEDGICALSGSTYVLKLDRETGLEIL